MTKCGVHLQYTMHITIIYWFRSFLTFGVKVSPPTAIVPTIQCTFGQVVHQDYDPFNKLFLSFGWTKVRYFLSQNLTLLRTKFKFKKVHCNAPRHFTDKCQSMLGDTIAYYTKFKLSRIYNHFAQTT